ncbi:MAG TPA: DeoR/GlpR family DNA-binding transcription regulator [Nocardioidaceae bacterium]|nr:DeoR/GlpR family DNA-binding transcription regulator [Nocardioidaceae bacterium]
MFRVEVTMPRNHNYEREDAILHEAQLHGRVSVDALAQRFDVSEVTIRKDLDALSRRSLIRRIRGGAIAIGLGEENTFAERVREQAAVKQAIGRHAAQLVSDGDVIVVDASSTAYYLALQILDRRDLIVVTDGIKTATLLMERSNATIVMPGGVLRRASGSMVGSFNNSLEGRGRIGKGFFGVAAISQDLGLLGLSVEEAETKKSMVHACEEVYGLFISSKVQGFGLHPFASPKEIKGLFTDDLVEREFVEGWTAAGVRVDLVPATPHRRSVRTLAPPGLERSDDFAAEPGAMHEQTGSVFDGR